MGRSRNRTRATQIRTAPRRANANAIAIANAIAPNPLRWALLILTCALGLVLGYREIVSPDIGFHLASARWILENAAFPTTDPFTYTVAENPYIDLQWGFQLLIYGMLQVGGTALIVHGTTGLTLAFGALLLVRAWRRDRGLASSSFLLLMLFFLGNQWEVRPHLLSWIWGSLVLLVLEEHARGSRRWLPLLPLLMVLWVNCHSLFVLGIVAIGTYLLCALRKPAQLDKSLLAWCAAAGLACLLNPYHIDGVLLPLDQLQTIQGSTGFKSPGAMTGELTSPFSLGEYVVDGRLVLFHPRLCWLLYTALALTGLLTIWRKIRLPELILFAAFLYVFWRANKNFGYFVMASFPVAATGLDQLGARIGATLGRSSAPGDESARGARWRLAYFGTACVACLVLIPLAWTGQLYDTAWTPHRRGTDYDKTMLPVGACEFINRNRIEGRILNSFGDGGYIAWATRQPVFIYGIAEVIGPEFYRQYFESTQPQGFPAALQKWQPTVAIVPFTLTQYWLYHLGQSREWRMVWADEYTALFLHISVAPHVPALSAPEPGIDYPILDAQSTDRLLRQAAEARSPNFWEWLQGCRAYPVREMTLSALYQQTGELDASIGIGLAGLQRTPFFVPELMLSLGHSLNAGGRYAWADLCFDAFLRVNQHPAIAAEIQRARSLRR